MNLNLYLYKYCTLYRVIVPLFFNPWIPLVKPVPLFNGPSRRLCAATVTLSLGRERRAATASGHQIDSQSEDDHDAHPHGILSRDSEAHVTSQSSRSMAVGIGEVHGLLNS